MKPIIIGVAGGSGCGKTTVVREIITRFGEEHIGRIQHDSYYYDRSDVPPDARAGINYDHPDSLETELLARHIAELKEGREVAVPVYDFANHRRLDDTVLVQPRRAVIVEGILVLAEPSLRREMDIKVFVDTDADLRVLRRLKRDIRKRGRSFDSVVKQYQDTVRPMHLEFVEPSKRHAHIIIPDGGKNTVAVDMLVTKIRSIVEATGGVAVE